MDQGEPPADSQVAWSKTEHPMPHDEVFGSLRIG
jgi:hypothetical protein